MKNLNHFYTAIAVLPFLFIATFAIANSVFAQQPEHDPMPKDSDKFNRALDKTPSGVHSHTAVQSSTIVTGTITGWPESGFVFHFDDHVSVVSDIQAWWSINRLDPDRGWFYGSNDSTWVAHVTGISDISEITDASMFNYTDWSVGPVDEGDFVLFNNLNTGFYAAMRVDDIYGPTSLEALADVTWYLQENGSPDFSPPRADCTLDVDLSFADGITTWTFLVGAPVPSTWSASVSLLGNDIPLWSIELPTLPPITISFSFPIPPIGVIEVQSTLAVEGGQCSASDAVNTTQGAITIVTVQEFSFSPEPVTITVGDTVQWDFVGVIDHTSTGAGGEVWNSGLVSPGGSFSKTFNSPGTFSYMCSVPGHAQLGMIGTVVVTAPP